MGSDLAWSLGSLNDSMLESSHSLTAFSRHYSGTIRNTSFFEESVTTFVGLLSFFGVGLAIFLVGVGLGCSRVGIFLNNGFQRLTWSLCATLSFSDLRGLDFIILTGS